MQSSNGDYVHYSMRPDSDRGPWGCGQSPAGPAGNTGNPPPVL